MVLPVIDCFLLLFCCCFEQNKMLTSCYFSNRCHLAVRLEGGFTQPLFLNVDTSHPLLAAGLWGTLALCGTGGDTLWEQEVCFLGVSFGSLCDEDCLV